MDGYVVTMRRRRGREQPPQWTLALAGGFTTLGTVLVVLRRSAVLSALRKLVPGLSKPAEPAQPVPPGTVEPGGQEGGARDETAQPGEAAAQDDQPAAQPAASQSAASAEPAPQAERTGAGDAGEEQSQRHPWHCECGQEYLVAGQDRHQIYWLKDADLSDPVLSDHCPNCERPLPAASRQNATD